MKKAFTIFMSLVFLVCAIPLAGILASADDPGNLAADYTMAGGQVTVNEHLEPWGGDYCDSKDTVTEQVSVAGGYGWIMGIKNTSNPHQAKLGRIYINAAGLKANTTYEFSYYYASKFEIHPGDITDPSGNVLSEVYPATNQTIGSGYGNSSHKVTYEFTTNASGQYTISLKTCTDESYYNTSFKGSEWAIRLSDLCLYETAKNYNLLANQSFLDEIVTAKTANAWSDAAPFYGGESYIYGTDDNLSRPGFTYLTLSDLAANTYYEFSYLYSGSTNQISRIFIDEITDATGAICKDTVIAPHIQIGYQTRSDITLNQGKLTGAVYKALVSFTTDAAGDYKVVLRHCREYAVKAGNEWAQSVLSDLRLVTMPKQSAKNLADTAVNMASGTLNYDWLAAPWYSQDTEYNGINGGNSWTFGADKTADNNSAATVSVLLENLKANTCYTYSYVYQHRFRLMYEGIYAEGGTAVTSISTSDLSLNTDTGARRVTVKFVTGNAGDYAVVMKVHEGSNYHNPDYQTSAVWAGTISDISLVCHDDTENMLNDVLALNGGVHFDGVMDCWNTVGTVSPYDNGAAWTFGLGATSDEAYGKTYVYANHLKANTTYTFSYKYYGWYAISFDSLRYIGSDRSVSVVSNDSVATETLLDAEDAAKPYEVAYTFTTADAGNYVFVLKASKVNATGGAGANQWATQLADLCLVEKPDGAVATAYNNKVAIRATGEDRYGNTLKQGMRIYNAIDKTWLEAGNIVEFGALAIRTTKLNGATLTLETAEAVSGVAWKKDAPATDNRIWDEDANSYYFTAVLTGIAAKYFDDTYTIVSYAKDDDGAVYYGGKIELSMYDAIRSVLSVEPNNATALELKEAGNTAAEQGEKVFSYDVWSALNTFVEE